MTTATKKRCYSCGRMLPRSEFYRNYAKLDGRGDECKECKRALNRKYTGPPITTIRPRDENREPYVIDPARIEAIRRLLATPCKVYWLPSTRSRCPHGRWEEECAACEKQERARMVFALAVEEDES